MKYFRYLLVIIRSTLFWPLFLLFSVLVTLTAYLLTFLSRRGFLFYCTLWSRGHRWLCRWVLGQKIAIEGAIPKGHYFFVIKHESMAEAIESRLFFDNPAVLIKSELFNIPMWNRLLTVYGHIRVDRTGGAKAMRFLRTSAYKMRDTGRPLILFPEGTRIPHGQAPPLRAGFAGLYSLLNIDVIPIAVNSGLLESANGWLKWPGVIRYKIGAIVPAGLPRREAEVRVHSAINALNSLPPQKEE